MSTVPQIGQFVVLSDDEIFQIIALDENDVIMVVKCWRPSDVIAHMHNPPLGRTTESFSRRELVLGTRHLKYSTKDIIRLTHVYSMDQLSKSHPDGEWYFYRQIVNDEGGGGWKLEPQLDACVLTMDGNIIVENPDHVILKCTARFASECLPETLYDSGRERDGHISDSPENFICPICEHASSTGRLGTQAGIDWLSSVDLTAIEEPDDPKRKSIIEKLFSNIADAGFSQLENDVSLVLSDRDLVHAFCVEVEREIFNATSTKPRDYKSKLYTINFNVGDKRNRSIRRRILMGEFSPLSLAMADSETLASDEIRSQRQEQRDKYFTTQVLKVKAGDEQTEVVESGDKKRIKLLHEENEPMEITPDFGPPPTNQPAPPDHEETVDSVPTSNESVGVVQHDSGNMDFVMAKAELRLFARGIFDKLDRLNYESQRNASKNLIEHLMKHV